MEYLFIWFLFGIVAAVIANSRGRGGCGWFLIGVLVGPFAFIVAFLPSATQKAMDKAAKRGEYGEFKKCPFCAEIVKIEAIKCKHCGSELPHNPVNRATMFTMPQAQPWATPQVKSGANLITKGTETIGN